MNVISFKTQYEHINLIETFLEEQGTLNVSIFECPELGFSENTDENGFPVARIFSIEIFNQSEEETNNLKDVLIEKFRETIFDIDVYPLDNNNWVDQYIKELKPVIIENFFIYNDYHKCSNDNKDLIPIKLNSALAFGSGEHQTTKACISMLTYIHDNSQGTIPHNVLDMGCGSGILAICAAKMWDGINITAIDIDENAVKIARDNFADNNISGDIFQASNLDALKQNNFFDLILCNILKQPLEDLGAEFFRVLKPNGIIITSGFITSQHEEIEQTYQQIGFRKLHTIQIDDWFAIAFKKDKI